MLEKPVFQPNHEHCGRCFRAEVLWCLHPQRECSELLHALHSIICYMVFSYILLLFLIEVSSLVPWPLTEFALNLARQFPIKICMRSTDLLKKMSCLKFQFFLMYHILFSHVIMMFNYKKKLFCLVFQLFQCRFSNWKIQIGPLTCNQVRASINTCNLKYSMQFNNSVQRQRQEKKHVSETCQFTCLITGFNVVKLLIVLRPKPEFTISLFSS